MSTIQNCQDIKFLQLLLKNYSRGSQNSEIIESIANRLHEKMESKSEIIRDLTTKNEQLVHQNHKLTQDLKEASDQLSETIQQKNKMQNALFERDKKLNIAPRESRRISNNSSHKSSTVRKSPYREKKITLKRNTSMQSIELHKNQINNESGLSKRNNIPKQKKLDYKESAL